VRAVRASRCLPAGLVLGLAVLALVHWLLRDTYWDYSEGVYALSAHMILHGHGLYTQMAGAQPPGVYLFGAVILALHDSVEWLRFGVACLQLGAGLIAGCIVLRITENRLAAALTPAAMLLTPWAVHEHGALTPELVALPVLLGAALLACTPRRAPACGVLCGLLPLIKLPMAIPAVVLLLSCPDRRRCAAYALATAAAGFGLTTALAGGSFWRETVVAQTQTGARSLGRLKGFWAQAGWNVLGLLVCAAFAVRMRPLARDRRMLDVSLALAVAMIVTFLTNFKEGTGLNITVPVEASLVPLAACGCAFAARQRSSRLAAVACAIAVAFTVAQSASLIIAPRHSVPFLRAFSRPAWAILMTRGQLLAAVAKARACPPGVPYSGPPLLALAARRPMPAGQPDQFIITHSRELAAFAAQIAAVPKVCP
jgi:hypothetical protein